MNEIFPIKIQNKKIKIIYQNFHIEKHIQISFEYVI